MEFYYNRETAKNAKLNYLHSMWQVQMQMEKTEEVKAYLAICAQVYKARVDAILSNKEMLQADVDRGARTHVDLNWNAENIAVQIALNEGYGYMCKLSDADVYAEQDVNGYKNTNIYAIMEAWQEYIANAGLRTELTAITCAVEYNI